MWVKRQPQHIATIHNVILETFNLKIICRQYTTVKNRSSESFKSKILYGKFPILRYMIHIISLGRCYSWTLEAVPSLTNQEIW